MLINKILEKFNKPSVTKIDNLNGKDILFKVKNGLGKLTMKFAKDINNDIKATFYLGDTPLIMCNSEYCPTCSTMIALAKGRDEADDEVVKVLSELNNIESLEDSFSKISPILSLLEDGYYVLKEVEFFPTDGEGNFFWNLKMKAKNYMASSYYYAPNHGTIIIEPKFLLPSQGTNSYNKDRVEYYRGKIRNGEKLFGLAIEMRGALGLLIDGHHKATACYLEGKPIRCITIINTFSYKNFNSKEEGISYTGNNIKYSDIKGGDSIKEFYENKSKNRKSNISYKEVYLKEKDIKSIDIGIPKEEFLDYDTYALSTLASDTSEEKIRDLLNYIGEDPLEELEEVFCNLRVNDKKRARELCFSILLLECFQNLWDECVMFLSQYNDEEVQELFVNLLVEYGFEYGHNKMKHIIDNYFKRPI
ncbi:cytoplasmic protein [Clostridium cagae]|uniref:cytoplasmic protein n=1 Tax=Clostridium cagae TaxID=2080751 RepID=UPI000CF73FB1|nr:cytoplasmic protein [Clostridium cagae]